MLTFAVFPHFLEKGYAFYGFSDGKFNKKCDNLAVIFAFLTFVFQKIGTFGGKYFKRNRDLLENEP